jgi:50S ribosomal protein L16 3-hydroxylase
MSAAPATLRRLGALSVEAFVARYWQKQPICLRQALPDFAAPLTPERLFALARDADVESRLVSVQRGRWQVRHGPISGAALPSRRRAAWTLLVQGVDLHEPAVAALAARFRFLPAARFDDVMISYASARGGVGPHVDQYDVFLLQAQGRRRWRIARRFDQRLVEEAPLRVLAEFRHEEEWVLGPGDMLYLPPGVAHEGVALDECVTISIGFRVPAVQDVAEAWSERQARARPFEGRLADGTRRPTTTPARLPPTLVDDALRQLRRGMPSRIDVRRTLLENLTEPKPTVFFVPPRPAHAPARFRAAARARGLQLDLKSRLLYDGKDLAINGELQRASGATPLLRRLANTGALGGAHLSSVPARGAEPFWALLYDWYRAGWVRLAAK